MPKQCQGCKQQIPNRTVTCKLCGHKQHLASAQVVAPSIPLVPSNPVHLGRQPRAKKHRPNLGTHANQRSAHTSDAGLIDSSNPGVGQSELPPEAAAASGQQPELHSGGAYADHDEENDHWDLGTDEAVPQRTAPTEQELNALFLAAYQAELHRSDAVNCLYFRDNAVGCITLPDCVRGVPLILQVRH
jgi:hypothetical protein